MFGLENRTLSELCASADASHRKRKHLNLHSSFDEKCQRLLNAIQPDSYIPPHRHMLSGSRELLIAIRGCFSLLIFDDKGNVTTKVAFGTELYSKDEGFCVAVEIPPNCWHTVLAERADSVLLEVKEGPFDPSVAKEVASWAPETDSQEALDFVRSCRQLSDSCATGEYGKQ